MDPRDDEIHLEPNEARAGSTPHVTRYVLGISLVLVIAAFILVWAIEMGHL